MVSRNSKTKSNPTEDSSSGWLWGNYLPMNAKPNEKGKYDKIGYITHNNKVIVGMLLTHFVKFKRRHFNPKMTPDTPVYVETDLTGKVTPDQLKAMDMMGEIVIQKIPMSTAKKLIPENMYRTMELWFE